jgi:2-dehydro-3-deoxyphosphogluconate aldolase/(4S)-4-hydroxy-2-oxoglutarate aldolase
VTPGNAASFLAAGCDGISAGGNLVNLKLIEAGDYAAISALAQEYTDVCSAYFT